MYNQYKINVFLTFSRLISTYANWMLTWPDLNQTSKNSMLKKLVFQITKVRVCQF